MTAHHRNYCVVGLITWAVLSLLLFGGTYMLKLHAQAHDTTRSGVWTFKCVLDVVDATNALNRMRPDQREAAKKWGDCWVYPR